MSGILIADNMSAEGLDYLMSYRLYDSEKPSNTLGYCGRTPEELGEAVQRLGYSDVMVKGE